MTLLPTLDPPHFEKANRTIHIDVPVVRLHSFMKAGLSYCKAYLRLRKLSMSGIALKSNCSSNTIKETDIKLEPCECGARSRKQTDGKYGLESRETREVQNKAINDILANMQNSDEVMWNSDTPLFDSHCHLQLQPLYENASEAIALALELGVKHMAVCGTEPGTDWQKVTELANAYPNIVLPSFGLHPWWIKQYYPLSQDNGSQKGTLDDNHSADPVVPYCLNTLYYNTDTAAAAAKQSDHGAWLPELEALLQQHPSAGVGEAGLDRGIIKEVPYALQEEVLLKHMHLAGRYQRTLTLHCVGCWDRLLGLLNEQHRLFSQHQKKLCSGSVKSFGDESAGLGVIDTPAHNGVNFPASIVLHSCSSMPIHLIQGFARLPNTFLSLSMGGRSNSGELSEKMKSFVRAIPMDRLLLETDSPDQLPSPFKLPHATLKPPDALTTDAKEHIEDGDNIQSSHFLQYNEPAMLQYHCAQLAQVLGISPQHLAQQATTNSINAFRVDIH